MEDPVYKMYRQQYYGYHPTCWRRFPSGWGCPSPEAPDAAKSFKEIPRDTVQPPPDEGDDRGMGPDQGAGGPKDRGTPPGLNPNNLPLPADRSPFEMDTKPDAAPNGTRPGAAAAPAPAPTPAPAPAPAPNNDGGAGLPPLAEPAVSAPSAANLPPLPVEPILALPDPTVAPSSVAVADDAAPPPPAQAPRRTRVISNLFGGIFRR